MLAARGSLAWAAGDAFGDLVRFVGYVCHCHGLPRTPRQIATERPFAGVRVARSNLNVPATHRGRAAPIHATSTPVSQNYRMMYVVLCAAAGAVAVGFIMAALFAAVRP